MLGEKAEGGLGLVGVFLGVPGWGVGLQQLAQLGENLGYDIQIFYHEAFHAFLCCATQGHGWQQPGRSLLV